MKFKWCKLTIFNEITGERQVTYITRTRYIFNAVSRFLAWPLTDFN